MLKTSVREEILYVIFFIYFKDSLYLCIIIYNKLMIYLLTKGGGPNGGRNGGSGRMGSGTATCLVLVISFIKHYNSHPNGLN